MTPGREKYPLLKGDFEDCQEEKHVIGISEIGEMDLLNLNEINIEKLKGFESSNNFKYKMLAIRLLEWSPGCRESVEPFISTFFQISSLKTAHKVLFVLFIISLVFSFPTYLVRWDMDIDRKVYCCAFCVRFAAWVITIPSSIYIIIRLSNYLGVLDGIIEKRCSTDEANGFFEDILRIIKKEVLNKHLIMVVWSLVSIVLDVLLVLIAFKFGKTLKEYQNQSYLNPPPPSSITPGRKKEGMSESSKMSQSNNLNEIIGQGDEIKTMDAKKENEIGKEKEIELVKNEVEDPKKSEKLKKDGQEKKSDTAGNKPKPRNKTPERSGLYFGSKNESDVSSISLNHDMSIEHKNKKKPNKNISSPSQRDIDQSKRNSIKPTNNEHLNQMRLEENRSRNSVARFELPPGFTALNNTFSEPYQPPIIANRPLLAIVPTHPSPNPLLGQPPQSIEPFEPQTIERGVEYPEEPNQDSEIRPGTIYVNYQGYQPSFYE